MHPAAILYFFPGASRPLDTGNGLERVPDHLRPRFRRGTRVNNSAGPHGKRGTLITWQENVLLAYDPASQDWHPAGDYWIGVRSDYDSADFAKLDPAGRHLARGYRVPMGDGREYVIPVALLDAPNFALPWKEGITAEGDISRQVDPRYRAVCDVAGSLWEHVSDDAAFEMPEDELREAAATAISVNYRLDLTDCLALGLFTSESYADLVKAILDVPAMDEMLKKKAEAPAPSGIDSGAKDASDATSPPTQTSP